LCPAGHLPHKGGDWQLPRRATSATPTIGESRSDIRSPLVVGEVPGRAEGGAVPPASPGDAKQIPLTPADTTH
ncbi:MAG: endonuclease domain-containing protein, partial [Mesorhizobium sp.]